MKGSNRVFVRMLQGAALVSLGLALLPAPARGQPWRPSVTWSSYLGGAQLDEPRDAVTNANDDVFVVGQTNSTSGFPADAGLPRSGSSEDAFVARFNQDGSLAWARVFGGTGSDLARRVRLAADGSGDVFVVGTLGESTSGIQTSPTTTIEPVSAQIYNGGQSDAFLARLSADGELRWFIFLGGGAEDEALSLAVDSTRVFVGGRSRSSSESFSGAGASKYGERGDGFDAFVTLVDVSIGDSPSLSWTRFIGTNDPSLTGGVADDGAYAVVLKDEALFVAGIVGSRLSDTDDSIIIIEDFHQGSDDGFVAKLDSQGGVAWFTNVGSSSADEVRDLLVAPGTGGLIAVGRTNSSSFLKSGFDGGGNYDAFVLRLTEGGGRERGLRVGGGNAEEVSGQAAVDALGNVFFGGRTLSGSGLALNAFDETYNASSEGFIAMVDSTLSRPVWVSYVGGTSSAEEWVRAVATGPQGRLTLVGHSDAPDVLHGDAGHDASPNGGLDGILFRVEVDPTAPRAGQVVGSISETGVFATWGFEEPSRNFSDPETGISRYEWAIGHSGQRDNVQAFTSVGTRTEDSASFKPQGGLPYVVTVRATNLVGRTSNEVTSAELTWTPPDAGTGDLPDAGTPPPDPAPVDVDPQSPLGWGCGSTGGGGLVGALGLVALASLMARRARRAPGSER